MSRVQCTCDESGPVLIREEARMTASTAPGPSEGRPLYRTPLGYRLDLRHRLAWRLADLASWLQVEAAEIQRRSHNLSRGEIAPHLPVLAGQFLDLAETVGLRSSELAAMVDEDRLNKGRDRRAVRR